MPRQNLTVGHYASHESPRMGRHIPILGTRSESEIVKSILAYLSMRRIFSWRTNNIAVKGRTFHGLKGVPDIIGILPGGQFLGIECKSATGTQSVEQCAFQAQCKSIGGVYVLARSVDDVVKALPPKPLTKIRRD
mgnify:CR=1 FL=1